MKIAITGGAGFIGLKLAQRILELETLQGPSGPEPVEEVVLFDQVAPPEAALADDRIRAVVGDILDEATVAAVIGPGTTSVVHLAAVVSGGAEADFELGYRVNLDGTRNVLEACRRLATVPRLLFASSIAVYGGALPTCVEDDTPITPETSYGAQKTMGELLVNDCSRKGYIDGRAMRLPTIVVRPGKPNKAASSFASGIIREPLAGLDFTCPVRADSRMSMMSPRRVIDCFIHMHELAAAALGANRRLLLSGISVSMAEAVAALERVGVGRSLGRIDFEIDGEIQSIVDAWPPESRSARALALGFPVDQSMDDIVRAHIEDEL